MTISGNGQYQITSDQIAVDEGQVTITGDAGGFTRTIGQSFYEGTPYDLLPIRIGADGYDPATLTLVGGGDGVSITIEDDGAPTFLASVNVGVGDYTEPNNPQGVLNITAGATLISRNNGVYDPELGFVDGGGNNVNIGIRGTGEANVVGDGSLLTAFGADARITVGHTTPQAQGASNGTLSITEGGDVGTVTLVVGRGQDGNGAVRIDGTGSTLTQSNDYGLFDRFDGRDSSQYGPFMTVGRQGGVGLVEISNGGAATVKNVDGLTDSVQVDLGQDYDSTGRIIVRNAGSSLNVTQIGPVDDGVSGNAGLKVGRGGQGILDIYDGGVVNVLGQSAFVSVGRTRDDMATSRSNQINISDGGVLNVDGQSYGDSGLNIAQEVGTNGVVTVEGEDSKINISSDGDDPGKFGAALVVGRRGDGQLFVEDGADITIDGGGDRFPVFFVGFGEEDGSANAKGFAKVSGAGSTITLQSSNADGETGFISVGRNNGTEGYLLIEGGGQVINQTTETGSEIAGNAGTTGKVHVTGDGSLFNAGTNLAVGADYTAEVEGYFDTTVGGDASLIASFGGRVEAERIIVGNEGELQIDGGIVAADITVTGNTEIASRGGAEGYTTGFATIEGSLTQTSGALYLDINDENVVTGGGYTVNHDVLNVSGDVTLDGVAIVLNVENLSNAAEDARVAVGDIFNLISAEGTLTVTNIDQFQFNSIGSDGVGISLFSEGNNLFASIDVLPNIAPVANDDAFAGSETATISGDLLLNDDGTDQAEFTLASVNGSSANISAIISLASGATLTVQADGSFVYDPNGAFDSLVSGQAGTDSFIYTIEDSFGAADQATAVLTISGEGVVIPPKPVGTSGPDEFSGTSQADQFDGGGGDDTISGGGGGDTLSGGTGKDQIDGGGGKDLLQGNGGKDLLQGKGGKDTLEGGGGRDTLEGGGGKDLLDGGGGKDLLQGGGGKDTLDGGGGKDSMEGGNGRDEIIGGRGSDILTGGGGGDRFIFDRGNGRDTITDFQQGRDKIVIEGGANDFGDLRIIQVGDDVRIQIANTRVIVEDDLVSNFTDADFIF